jgi:hypothetical protein
MEVVYWNERGQMWGGRVFVEGSASLHVLNIYEISEWPKFRRTGCAVYAVLSPNSV